MAGTTDARDKQMQQLGRILGKLHGDASKVGKADEVDALMAIRQLVADRGLYLSSLFSDQMVGWAANHIYDDVAPDLYSWMQDAHRAATKAEQDSADQAKQAQAQIDHLTHMIGQHEQTIKNMTGAIDRAQDRADTYKAAGERVQVELDRTRVVLDDLGTLAKQAWFDGRQLDPSAVAMVIRALQQQ